MNKLMITQKDLGLLYLSNFKEGLNYYQWDRKIIYDLKAKCSPNELIHYFKKKRFVKLEIKNNTKFYLISDTGIKYCKKIFSEYKAVFDKINDTISTLELQGHKISQIHKKLPVISFYYNNRKYKIIFEKTEDEELIRVFLPNDLKEAVNEIKFSMEGFNRSEYLREILAFNFKFLSSNVNI